MMQRKTGHVVTLRRLPTLAFADALTFAVIFVSLITLKRLGLDNDETTLTVSLLFTPWLLLPFTSRLLSQIQRPRLWIVGTELVSALLLILVSNVLDDNMVYLPVVVFLLWLVSVCGIVHNIATRGLRNKAFVRHQRIAFIIRLTFSLLAMMVCQGLAVAFAGNMEVITRTVQSSWSTTINMLAFLFLVLSFIHVIILRKVDVETTLPTTVRQSLFMSIDHRTAIITVLLLLTLVAEGLTAQVGQIFFVDAPHNGGLGLSPSEYGLTQGTVAMVGLAVGLTIGHYLVRKRLNGTLLYIMAASMTLPVCTLLYLSYVMTNDLVVVGACVTLRQTALGLGMAVCYRKLSDIIGNSDYCITLLAIPLIVAGMLSGVFQESVGYRTYFLVLLSISPIAFIAVALMQVITRKGTKSNSDRT